jgi:DNA-binding NarL/FixJ family response regulator
MSQSLDPSVSKPTVLVADDVAWIRQEATQMLSHRFSVIGIAKDGRAAVAEALALNPDVVILDIAMPLLDGIQAASELKRRRFPGRIVILTVSQDPEFTRAAIRLGVNAYILKKDLYRDLVHAVEEAIMGRSYYSAAVDPSRL